MPEEDPELSESRTGEPDAPQGTPSSPVRLAQDVDEGGPGPAAEVVLSPASLPDDPVPPCDVCDGNGACVGTIKAFVRGGMPGLRRLHAVLPNIFKTFPDEDARSVLVECGLMPVVIEGAEYPSFMFDPLKGCPLTPEKKKRKKGSDELVKDYETARSGWST
jgi:hypothetical protein